MEQLNLFGKNDEEDGLPVSRECMENLYCRWRYDADQYVGIFGSFPEADAVFPWLFLGGSNAEVAPTIEEVKTLNSLNVKEKKQIAIVLAKAFCGEEFLLPWEQQLAGILKEDGAKLADVPVMRQTTALRLIAVRQNGMALRYCSNPEDLVIEAALAQNGLAFQFLGRKYLAPTYDPDDSAKYHYWRTLALAQNGLALQFMDEQEPAECILAIKQNPESAMFVTDEEILGKCHGDLNFLVRNLDKIANEIYGRK